MILSLHNAFAAGRIRNETALDFLLPSIIGSLQNEFCRFVDAGAGVGYTASIYDRILTSCLAEEHQSSAIITCYEPLADNFVVLSDSLSGNPRYNLRNVAVNNENGKTTFNLPARLLSDQGAWKKGTSFDGFIGSPNPSFEVLEVETVRIEDDLEHTPDFVKLDLQGGELEALKGLDQQLDNIKLLYIEAELLAGSPKACELLVERGYLVMFDKFQFGLNAGVVEFPLDELADMGICVDRVHMAQSSGFPGIFWGHMTAGRDLFDGFTFSLEARERLGELGINYFQTDAIGINLRYADKILPLLGQIA